MDRFLERIRSLVFEEAGAVSRIHRFILSGLRLAYHVAANAWQDAIGRRAAALSFFTVLYLLPILILVLFGLNRSPLFRENMDSVRVFLLEQLVTPAATQLVEDLFETLSQHLDLLGSGVAGLLALITLLGLGTSLLRMIQKALNRIWNAPRKGGSILGRLALLWTGITLLPLLLAFSFALTAEPAIQALLGEVPSGFLSYLVPLTLTALIFWFLYGWVPATRVRWFPSLVAAAVAALFWEIAKVGLSKYVQMMFARSLVSQLYGSLSLVPIGLLWIYYTWLIVLLGAELAYVLQNLPDLQADGTREWTSKKKIRPLTPRMALAFLWEALDTFRKGEGATDLARLAHRYHIPTRESEAWISALEAKKILVQTADGRLVPVRPPEGITVGEILTLYLSTFPPPGEPTSKPIQEWLREEIASLLVRYEGVTLLKVPELAADKSDFSGGDHGQTVEG